jgi:hypothetical protein
MEQPFLLYFDVNVSFGLENELLKRGGCRCWMQKYSREPAS